MLLLNVKRLSFFFVFAFCHLIVVVVDNRQVERENSSLNFKKSVLVVCRLLLKTKKNDKDNDVWKELKKNLNNQLYLPLVCEKVEKHLYNSKNHQ